MNRENKEVSVVASFVVFLVSYTIGVIVADTAIDAYYYFTGKKRPTDGSNY